MRCLIVLVAVSFSAAPASAQKPDSSHVDRWVRIFNRGLQAQRVHNERLARMLFDSVLALDPRNSMAYFYRAIANHNLGDRTAAIADFEKALALGNTMAELYLTGPYRDALEKGVAPGVSDQLMRAEELNTSGMEKLARGDTAGAMKDLEEAGKLGNVSAGAMHQSLVARLFSDSVRANPQVLRHRPPFREYGLGMEVLLFLTLATGLAVIMAVVVRLTPAGVQHDDELAAGEKLLWLGAPKQGYFLGAEIVYPLLFGVVWFGGLYAGVGMRLAPFLTEPSLWVLWSLLFIGVGLWVTVGGYFLAVRRRKQTTYLLSDRRVLVAHGIHLIEHKLEKLGKIKVKRHRDGTFTLGTRKEPALLERVSDGDKLKALLEEASKSRKP